MKKIGKECYADTQEELSSMIGLSVRHIFSLIKLGGPGKTEFGYPVEEWVRFLVGRAKRRRGKAKQVISATIDADLEKFIKELSEE